MPGGRPSKIDAVVGKNPDGSLATASQRILTSLGAGSYFEQAIAETGLHKSTVYGWLKIGAQASAKLHRGLTNPKSLTAHERRCIQFSDAVATAEANWERRYNDTLDSLARGGLTTTVVTEKHNAAGEVIERTTRTETHAPNAQVLEWRLTRRFPDRYAGRVELSGPQGGPIPIEERLKDLGDNLRDFLAGAAMGADLANGQHADG